jgi:hypothetical protein
MFAIAAFGQQKQKSFKDEAESALFAQISKDLAANDFAKVISGLDSWEQKYPESELKDDRQLLYMQTYFKAAAAIQQATDPTDAQLALAEKGANWLLKYDKKPEGITDAAWAEAKGQLQSAARGALLYVALAPGMKAMKAQDCENAEAVFTKALQQYPDSAQASYLLGTATLCQYKKKPEKASPAMYAFARAAAADPVKGMVDPNWQKNTVAPYLEKIYSQFHGADAEGLKSLKELAVQSPLPPAGFKIKSVTEIAQEKQAEFEKSNPQLAMWMKIKGALADSDGEQYFANNLKDAAVPELRGVLVEARPACRPKELLVAVPLPDAPRPLASEITLKLDKALTGAPAANAEIQWKGVPSAFAASPFMLTMDTEVAAVQGLNLSPCTAAPAAKKGGAAKKAPGKKK